MPFVDDETARLLRSGRQRREDGQVRVDSDFARAERGGTRARGLEVSRRGVRHHQVAPAGGDQGPAARRRREWEIIVLVAAVVVAVFATCRCVVYLGIPASRWC